MTATKTKKPPKKLSALLQLAYDDLRKCERSKKYKIEMGEWCKKIDGRPCEVCMAGDHSRGGWCPACAIAGDLP